ncbi:unnamed protein product, partial [Anisakis simplex]|uniref:G-patch domain-containing protein n=1 Tax=Anisakis simplex TaxID=6269 RepID=A0A0M3JAL0_ANISI
MSSQADNMGFWVIEGIICWTPKQFKSSRNERGEHFEQNIEDYMDEEDVGEYGIAARRMRTTLDDNFLKKGDNQKLAWERSGQSSLDVFIFSESVGIRLLKKMGWREGQGIGPKMSRRTMEKHKRGSPIKMNFDRVDAEEMAPGFEFAPEDVLAHYLHSRSGTRGLGYEGLRKTEVLSEQYGIKEATLKTKRKSKGIRGQVKCVLIFEFILSTSKCRLLSEKCTQWCKFLNLKAFGVGAFEDEDESIYTSF